MESTKVYISGKWMPYTQTIRFLITVTIYKYLQLHIVSSFFGPWVFCLFMTLNRFNKCIYAFSAHT